MVEGVSQALVKERRLQSSTTHLWNCSRASEESDSVVDRKRACRAGLAAKLGEEARALLSRRRKSGELLDLDQGLIRLGAQPEVSYVLGFSPRELKLDGKYHTLKVSLTSKANWTLQARRGYFAPRASDNSEQAAYAEIDQALTSQDELRELPLESQTQMFKMANQARLSVVAHIDTKNLKFRRVDDRNDDNLKVVMALFDNNGNFLSAIERGINLQLKDTTLTALNNTGIRVKLDFDVHPGTFLVRVVVRDSVGAQLGATTDRLRPRVGLAAPRFSCKN